MILEISVYFGIQDERIDALVENLLTEQMPDGGWNCRRHRKPYPHHSSGPTFIRGVQLEDTPVGVFFV